MKKSYNQNFNRIAVKALSIFLILTLVFLVRGDVFFLDKALYLQSSPHDNMDNARFPVEQTFILTFSSYELVPLLAERNGYGQFTIAGYDFRLGKTFVRWSGAPPPPTFIMDRQQDVLVFWGNRSDDENTGKSGNSTVNLSDHENLVHSPSTCKKGGTWNNFVSPHSISSNWYVTAPPEWRDPFAFILSAMISFHAADKEICPG